MRRIVCSATFPSMTNGHWDTKLACGFADDMQCERRRRAPGRWDWDMHDMSVGMIGTPQVQNSQNCNQIETFIRKLADSLKREVRCLGHARIVVWDMCMRPSFRAGIIIRFLAELQLSATCSALPPC
eukprot:Polyplicarium_translucidae@DN4566_c0_g1_i1.p2